MIVKSSKRFPFGLFPPALTYAQHTIQNDFQPEIISFKRTRSFVFTISTVKMTQRFGCHLFNGPITELSVWSEVFLWSWDRIERAYQLNPITFQWPLNQSQMVLSDESSGTQKGSLYCTSSFLSMSWISWTLLPYFMTWLQRMIMWVVCPTFMETIKLKRIEWGTKTMKPALRLVFVFVLLHNSPRWLP